MSRALGRMGGWCAAHPSRVLAAWLVVVAAVVTLSVTAGGSYKESRSLPGTEVAAADDRLQAHFPSAAGTSADLLLYDASPAQMAGALTRIETAVADLPHVVTPSAWPLRLSADGRTVLLHVTYDVPRLTLGTRDLDALKRAGHIGGVTSYVSGVLANDLDQPGSGTGEKVGVAVALLVLLFAFGSVIAALMPIATAALAILTGLAFVKLLANVYPVSSSGPQLATMLGLGVGIDYALFIVTRHRERLREGLTPSQAATDAMTSAGTSVLWAGVTVVVAICGLGFAGIPTMTSLGLASAIVVAVSVVAALTILPALLSVTGDRIDRLHVALPHLRRDRAGTRWIGWAQAIERRPVRYLLGSVGLLVVLAIPLASLRLGMPDGGAADRNTDTYRAYTLTTRAFGVGANAPMSLVFSLPTGVNDQSVAASYRRAVSADPDVASVGPLTVSPDSTTAVVSVTARSAPQAASTSDLVSRLFDRVLPPVEHTTGSEAWLAGMVPGRYDVAQRVLDRLPWFVLAVLSAAFVLLMVVFRSVLVPVKAVLLNLLSIGSALGVVVAVFQWGWLRQLVGLSEPVPLVDVIPMLMFAVVFGLSMDYEVFLLSRIREEWVIGRDGRGSVVRGLASTAQVISAAAAIMVAVFLAFTLSNDVVVKTIGLGMAVAVFLDATVIRLVLVPATMALLGDLNWWVPRWLDRLLPHIDIDAAVPVTPLDPIPGPARVLGQETEVPIPRPTA